MRKIKMPRGFYSHYRLDREAKRKMKRRHQFLEFWLKHLSDPQKDIHFYVRWRAKDEIEQAWQFLATINDEEYEDDTWMRSLNYPRTRAEKAIQQSRVSGLKHLSQIV